MNGIWEKIYLSIKKAFSEVNFKLNIKNLGYLPRWLILLLDIIVVAFSFIITILLFEGIKLQYIQFPFFSFLVILGYVFLNTVSFWVFKTYSGIIRHSTLIDAVKIIIAQLAVFITVLLLNGVSKYYYDSKILLTTGAFFNSLITFILLFVYRVFVKQIFENYLDPSVTKTRVLIYGTDFKAIAVANAIKAEVPKRFYIKGFIDPMAINEHKHLINLPIFSIKKTIPVLLRYQKVDGIIIADDALTKEESVSIADQCTDYNFKVFVSPKITNWNNDKNLANNIKEFDIHDLLERNPIVLNNDAISKDIENKVVLVTGAAGSIGSEIVLQVLKFNPKKLVLLDQAETPLNNLSILVNSLATQVELVYCIADVKDNNTIEALFATHKPDMVFHAAAYKHVPLMEENPKQAVLANVLGTKNIADTALQYGAQKFVMVSTDKAVNPSNVMGASKRIAELYVQSLQHLNKEKTTKFITTRFGNVLGSNGSVVPLFNKQIKKKGPVTITHPDIIRYFMTIPEACQLVLEAGTMGKGGEIFIFDMGKPVKIIDLAKKMIRLAGYIPEKDIKIDIVGLRPGEKLYEELLHDTSKNVPTYHEKIMIAIDDTKDCQKQMNLILELISHCTLWDNYQIVAKMKEIVPEFMSLNSPYQALDK